MTTDDLSRQDSCNPDLQNELLTTSLRNTPLAYILWETDGDTVRILDWNPAAETLFGWKKEEVIGRSFFDFIPPNSATPSHKDTVVSLHADGDPHSVDHICNTRDGGTVHVRWFNSTLPLGDTGKVLIVAFGEDLTERDRLTESIRNSEERFRNLFERVPLAIYRALPEGTITHANDALAKLLRAESVDDVIGSQARDVYVNEEDRQRFLDTLTRDGSVQDFEVAVACLDGTHIWVRNSAHAVRDADGRLIEIEGSAEDITERRLDQQRIHEHEQRLQSLASELAKAEEATRRRIAVEVHDLALQNLIGINVKLQITDRTRMSEEDRAQFDSAIELLNTTIRDVRTLTFELSPPVLYDLGLEAALAWLVREHGKRYEINVEFRDDDEPKPIGDDARALLFRATRELLTNVAKHAQAKSIIVSVRRVHQNIEISVADDGVGADVARMEGGGKNPLGFGLFSIREHLIPLGGSVQFSAEEGLGTCVWIRAPLKSETDSRDEGVA
jgi:PAS domain S-box-containing protein